LKIFISYARTDGSDFAASLRESLIEMGHQVFRDMSGIDTGDIWSHTIEENLLISDILLVIVTPRAILSREIEKEVLLVLKNDKKIIPCFYRDVDLKDVKGRLATIQGIFFDNVYDLVRKVRMIIKILSECIIFGKMYYIYSDKNMIKKAKYNLKEFKNV
jgi:uncharacterized protein YunC (DUF1805 family)